MGPTLTKEAPRRYLRFYLVSLDMIVDSLDGFDDVLVIRSGMLRGERVARGPATSPGVIIA